THPQAAQTLKWLLAGDQLRLWSVVGIPERKVQPDAVAGVAIEDAYLAEVAAQVVLIVPEIEGHGWRGALAVYLTAESAQHTALEANPQPGLRHPLEGDGQRKHVPEITDIGALVVGLKAED